MLKDEVTVEVRDVNLVRKGVITANFLNLKATIRHLAVGEWELTLPKQHPMVEHLLTTGSGIIVSMRGQTRFSGMTTRPKRETNLQNPDGTYTFKGVTDDILLLDALAFPAPTIADPSAQTKAADTRTGNAESLMRSFVSANIVNGVAPAGRIDGFRQFLRLETTNQNRGLTLTKAPRFQNMFELLTEIAVGSDLGFQVIQRGSDLVFEVLTLLDRSDLVRLDIKNGTITSETTEVSAPRLTRAIVAGQGEGVAREIIQRTTTQSLDSENSWGRVIEQFIDQRNAKATVELEQSGDETLIAGQLSTTAIKIVPSDDQTMLYGVDWEVGDTIAVVIDEAEARTTVTAATMIINDQMAAIGASIGDVREFDASSALVKRVESTESRVANLERAESALVWTDVDSTFEFPLNDQVTLQIGQEQVVRVKNATGATLTKGLAIYPTGSTGTNKTVAKAQANAEATSSMTFGVLTQDILNGELGFATTFGMVHDINTSALTEGAAVYLSPTVAGGLTSTKPSAPNHMVLIGFCIRSHAVNGSIFVKIQNGFELNEIHDVAISSPSAGQTLTYDGSKWVNGAGVPTGTVSQFAGSTAPSGYLLCQGQSLSTTTYATLFGVIGYQYGGSGASFNLPDLQNRIPIGKGSGSFATLNNSGGAETIALSTANVPSHTHTFSATTSSDGYHAHNIAIGSTILGYMNGGVSSGSGLGVMYGGSNGFVASGNGAHTHTISGTTGTGSGSGSAFNKMPPYLVLNFIIKT